MRTIAAAVLTAALAVALVSPSAACGRGAGSGGLDGRQAVQFTVNRDFELTAFQGQMFSYQRFLSDTRAIRFAGGLFLDHDDTDVDAALDGGDQVGEADLKHWDYQGTIKIQMVFYRGRGPVWFYYGAGPKFSYRDYHGESINFSTYTGELEYSYRRQDTDEWTFGLQGFAGVEWHINETFALHAEYAVSGVYKYSKQVETRFQSTEPAFRDRYVYRTNSPEFDSDGVRFGLSVYF